MDAVVVAPTASLVGSEEGGCDEIAHRLKFESHSPAQRAASATAVFAGLLKVEPVGKKRMAAPVKEKVFDGTLAGAVPAGSAGIGCCGHFGTGSHARWAAASMTDCAHRIVDAAVVIAEGGRGLGFDPGHCEHGRRSVVGQECGFVYELAAATKTLKNKERH